MTAADIAHPLGEPRREGRGWRCHRPLTAGKVSFGVMAADVAQRWLAEGRRVRIAMPPGSDTDMADVLVGRDYRRNQHDAA
jgi:hypothetical protein